ncbi:zeta toxin family protein [Variovorax robiniae]|uniref:Zeta toxin family protein n=1 Tax=Variovorax robiniae TaxID=1836199 RepID=A0ABU8XE53_9BURK
MSTSKKPAPPRPFIFVLAGVNGAGKSSVGGAMLLEHGLTWYNPDSFARELAQSGVPLEEANAQAWQHGKELLQKAIAEGANHALETTLGANTMPALLEQAAASHAVVMLFCGLESAEMHIERVRLRVTQGGHDIPDNKIRERWTASRLHLIKLMPHLARLQVFDNSAQAKTGQKIPNPILVLEMLDGVIVLPDLENKRALESIPAWARPIVQAAVELQISSGQSAPPRPRTRRAQKNQ